MPALHLLLLLPLPLLVFVVVGAVIWWRRPPKANVEIERKFLVNDASVVRGFRGTHIEQGFLAEGGMTVRIRLAGSRGYLTLKGARKGLAQPEFEFRIPRAAARELLDDHCSFGRLSKMRYRVAAGRGLVWEVDVYEGALEGLLTAEVELSHESQEVQLPQWLGAEVSNDRRFSNASLAAAQTIPSL